jgi:hypothetical protein
MLIACIVLGMVVFVPSTRSWEIIAFAFLSLLLVVDAGSQVVLRARIKTNRRGRLQDLTDDEKSALQEYINHRRRTVRWPAESGTITTLANDGILLPSGSKQDHVGDLAFNISEWAFRYLMEHPDLLKTSEDYETDRLP